MPRTDSDGRMAFGFRAATWLLLIAVCTQHTAADQDTSDYQQLVSDARRLLSKGQPSRALELARKGMRVKPDDYLCYFLAAQACAHLGQNTKGLEYVEVALARAPKAEREGVRNTKKILVRARFRSLLASAKVSVTQGHIGHAGDSLWQAYRMMPHRIDVGIESIRLSTQLEHYEEARERLAKIRAGAEATDLPAELTALSRRVRYGFKVKQARRLIAAGTPKEAIPILRNAIDASPTGAEAPFHLARCLSLMGRLVESIGALRRAVRNGLRVPSRIVTDIDLYRLRGNSDYVSLVRGVLGRVGEEMLSRSEFDLPKGWSLAGRNHQGFLEVKCSSDKSTMIWIPAGEFPRGAARSEVPGERPVRRVYVRGFFINKHEITWEQYLNFCHATSRKPPRGHSKAKARHPVSNVSWEDAAAYCRWAGVSLPTEAQWEKAARGQGGRLYPWGAGFQFDKANSCSYWLKRKVVRVDTWKRDFIDRYWRAKGRPLLTLPVGRMSGDSPYGCKDMAGNVAEWCADFYSPEYYSHSPARDPKGPGRGEDRVVRGGSWFSLEASLRTYRRDHAPSTTRDGPLGFRTAHEATSKRNAASKKNRRSGQ